MPPETQIDSQPTNKQVVEARPKPAYPLISNQPDRFGALSEAFLFVEEKRIYELFGKVKFYSVVAAVLLAIPIAIHLYVRFAAGAPLTGTVLDVAKILIVYVLIGSVLALVGFYMYRHKIMELLAQLEDLAYFGDDMARFYMPYVRSELKEFNDKIRKAKDAPDEPNPVEIMKDLWPVVSMLLKRDADILKWGKVGMRAYKTLSTFFKGHDHSSEST